MQSEPTSGQEGAAEGEAERKMSRRRTIQFKEAELVVLPPLVEIDETKDVESVVPSATAEGDQAEEAPTGTVGERPSRKDEVSRMESFPLLPDVMDQWLPPLNDLTGEIVLQSSLPIGEVNVDSITESSHPPSEPRQAGSLGTSAKELEMSMKTSLESSVVKPPSMTKDVGGTSAHTQELEEEAEQVFQETITERKT